LQLGASSGTLLKLNLLSSHLIFSENMSIIKICSYQLAGLKMKYTNFLIGFRVYDGPETLNVAPV